VRVSRQGEREDDRFRSPAFQREAIERFAAAEGLALKMFPDEIDVSGAKSKRPTLDAIVAAIEAGELAGLIVAKLDRLSRLGPRERIELFERIEGDAGGVILSATESNDVSTPEGRFVRELFLSLARMEWEKKKEAFSVARAIANGIAVKRQAPFGYRIVEGRHVVEPTEAPTVRAMFELRADGASYADVLAVFEQATGRSSSRETMSNLLKNRTFLGELRHGEFLLEDAHPAIVDVDLFEAVQAVGAARRGAERRWNGRASTLLATIAECASCGRGLRRSERAGGGHAVYKCPSSARPTPAPAPRSGWTSSTPTSSSAYSNGRGRSRTSLSSSKSSSARSRSGSSPSTT
jgi:DNA invertase Pin-like site-specific DNA recombinase